jgi:hypothetical protein
VPTSVLHVPEFVSLCALLSLVFVLTHQWSRKKAFAKHFKEITASTDSVVRSEFEFERGANGLQICRVPVNVFEKAVANNRQGVIL